MTNKEPNNKIEEAIKELAVKYDEYDILVNRQELKELFSQTAEEARRSALGEAIEVIEAEKEKWTAGVIRSAIEKNIQALKAKLKD